MYLLASFVASTNLCGSMIWLQKEIPCGHTIVPACRVPAPPQDACSGQICSIITPLWLLEVLALGAQNNRKPGWRDLEGMPENHPDPQLLERFLRNEASREERRWIVRHLLAGCAQCGAITRRLWKLAEPGPKAGREEPPPPEPREETALRAAHRAFLAEGKGAEAAAALLDLAVLYARQGRAAEILALTQDLLPIFRTRDLRKGVATALVYLRSLAESGAADEGLLAEMARFVGPRP